jgi:DnaJ-domain-containing protein 1
MDERQGHALVLLSILALSFFGISSFSFPVTAQTQPFTVSDAVSAGHVDYWWISDVSKGDLVLLTIVGDVEFQLSYPNFTVIDLSDKAVQFIANTTSDLLLRITAIPGKSYTVQSTHQLSRQPMPYAGSGLVKNGGFDYWTISNVHAGDLFLLVVSGEDFWDWESQLMYTDLSVIDTIGGTTTDTPRNPNHIFQFYAKTTNDLLLRISPPWHGDMTYTVQCTHPIPMHNVAVTAVSPDKTSAFPGDVLNISAEVSNLGDYAETFNVTASYGSNLIDTIVVNNLTSQEKKNLNFQWDTTKIAFGKYTISVTAKAVPFEAMTTDNKMTSTEITIRDPTATPSPTPTPTPGPTSTPTPTPTPTSEPTPTPTLPPSADFMVTASAGPGGTIDPSGAMFTTFGESFTFTITPDFGYHILDVTVDGVSQGNLSTYKLTDIRNNHEISVTFSPTQTPPPTSTSSASPKVTPTQSAVVSPTVPTNSPSPSPAPSLFNSPLVLGVIALIVPIGAVAAVATVLQQRKKKHNGSKRQTEEAFARGEREKAERERNERARAQREKAEQEKAQRERSERQRAERESRQGSANLNGYFATLGVPKNATKEQVKKAYYDLVQIWHPDKVAHVKNPEFTKMAHDRFIKIQQAYEEIMKAKGWT